MHIACGHHPVNVGNAHFDCWGRGPLLLRYRGRERWFEFSDMFGPLLLRKADLERHVSRSLRTPDLRLRA